MRTRNIFFFLLAMITLLLVACSNGGDALSVAKIGSPDPTATPVPASTEVLTAESTAKPTAKPTPGPTAAPEPAATLEPASPASQAPAGLNLGSLGNIDTAELMREVMGSPELMGCLTNLLGFTRLMGIAERQPTDAEMELILPCFSEDQLNSLLGGLTGLTGSVEPAAVPQPTATPAPTEAPASRTQTALVRPEGVPWYDGPLFDSHMHMTGVTVSFFEGTYTTSDVLRVMDRHNIEGGVAFWMPPVFGR